MQAPAPARKRKGGFDIAEFMKDEYNDSAKFKANLRLLRGLGIFLGSVYVFRNFGEALFAA